MGNIQDAPLCYQRYEAPMLKTPITDYFLRLINFQSRTECGMYELHYVDCMEAYGHDIGMKKCRVIYEDLHECIFRFKQMRRVHLMRKERMRQYRNGERKNLYPDNLPPVDLY